MKAELEETLPPVFAPWTDDQVASLTAFQISPRWHPFTCGRDGCRRPLRPTSNGWICDRCEYAQTWAHEFMTDWSWKEVTR